MKLFNHIFKLLSAFLWKGKTECSSFHNVNWRKVNKPLNEGGLGFCDLSKVNLASLGKHFWRVITNKERLWVKWYMVFAFQNIPYGLLDFTLPFMLGSWNCNLSERVDSFQVVFTRLGFVASFPHGLILNLTIPPSNQYLVTKQ